MNTLEIDHEQLAREAEAAISPKLPGGAPPPFGAPAAAPVPESESWAPIVSGLMGLADVVAPNWDLLPEEKSAFADALTPILDQLFPGGFGNERWAPYVRLAAVSAGIVMVRVEDGRLKPLRKPPAPPPPPPAANAGAANGGA